MDFEETDFKEEADDINLIGCLDSDVEEKIAGYIRHVLNKIPRDDAASLKRKNLFFVLPASTNCTAIKKYLTPLNADTTGVIPVWFIYLAESLISRPEHEAIYTIAHELAHLFLDHDGRLTGDFVQALKATEQNADRKVIEWGFEEELRKTPYNYLHGNGIVNILESIR